MKTGLIISILASILLGILLWIGRRMKEYPAAPASDPKQPPRGYLILATDALLSKWFAKAQEFVLSGVRLNLKNPRTSASLINILGNVSTDTKSLDSAEKHFAEAAKTDLTFAFPHNNLGWG